MNTIDAALPGSQLLVVEDQTSPGVLTPRERFNLAWALNYQALYHYGRSSWVRDGYAPPAHVLLLPRGMRPPAGAWNIILLDTSDQASALGYHEDEAGSSIPFSEVFVKTAREDGADPAEVASHEMIEMLVDPDVNKVRTVTHDGKLYIVEVCDPVQGCGYDVGAPEGRACGIIVADFAEPAWFDLPQSEEPERMSFRSSIAQPFELAPPGYISVAPVGTQNWTQIFGSQKDRLPAWASRLPRIHGGTPDVVACEPLAGREKHPSNRQLLELLPLIRQEIHTMQDALADLQADEAELATIVPKLIARDEEVSRKLADFEAKAAAGEIVPAGEVATLKQGFDASLASLKALLPAEAAEPTKTVYTFTPGEGVSPDERFSASGFQIPAVAAVAAVPADPTTGTPEVAEVPAKPAEPVLEFNGDTAPGETNGATVPGYAVYTGTVEPVPAAA